MFRFWRNFPFMVALGLLVGLATGGYPSSVSGIIPQVALISAMTFSLTEIAFRGISLRAQARGIVVALVMSYVVLGGLVLAFAALSPDPDIRSGWVLMAAVPPAVLIIPLTSLLRGDVRTSLISDAALYLLGLATVPVLSLLLLGRSVSIEDLVVQTILLIGVPLVISRPLRRWPRIHDVRPTAVGVSFFFIVSAVVGSTRGVLLGRLDLVAGLSFFSLLRTFGLGLLVLGLSRIPRLSRDHRIAAVTFCSFKNLGLTVVLASTFFSPLAGLPAIVSLVFELLWMSSLPFLFRVPPKGVEEIGE